VHVKSLVTFTSVITSHEIQWTSNCDIGSIVSTRWILETFEEVKDIVNLYMSFKQAPHYGGVLGNGVIALRIL
jgi:hypothetical protein